MGLWQYCLNIKSSGYNINFCKDWPKEGKVKELPFIPVDKMIKAQEAGVASTVPLGLCLLGVVPLRFTDNPKGTRLLLFLMAALAAAGGAAATTAVTYFLGHVKEGNYTLAVPGLPMVTHLTYGDSHLLLITVSSQCAVSTALYLVGLCLLPPLQDSLKSASPNAENREQTQSDEGRAKNGQEEEKNEAEDAVSDEAESAVESTV